MADFILTYPDELAKADAFSTLNFISFFSDGIYPLNNSNSDLNKLKVTVNLPIPEDGLSQSNGSEWNIADSKLATVFNRDSLSTMKDASAVDAALGLLDSGTDDDSALIKFAVSNKGVTAAPGQIAVFKNSKLREYTFKYKMIPRNPKEADLIAAITETFQISSLPTRPDAEHNLKANGGVLYYPTKWEIKVKHDDHLPSFMKHAILETIEVSHGESGKYSEFEGWVPTVTTISMTFKETQRPTVSSIQSTRGSYISLLNKSKNG